MPIQDWLLFWKFFCEGADLRAARVKEWGRSFLRGEEGKERGREIWEKYEDGEN